MKKYFTLLIFPFLFLNNVFAIETEQFQTSFVISESSCTNNLANPTFITGARLRNGQSVYSSCTTCYASQLIPVKPNTTYTLSFSRSVSSVAISSLATSSSSVSMTTLSASGGSYTTSSDATYLVFYMTSNAWGDISTFDVMLNEGSTALEYTSYSTSCTPTPPTPPSDTSSFSDFLPLYLDKITYLGNGFINNSYLFSFVSIIFAWCVLELFIRLLHLRKGTPKL